MAVDQIREALSKLDPKTDEHWTSDGQPKVDVIQQLSGDSAVTRASIIAAAPDFTRAHAVLPEIVKPEPSAEERKRERERTDEIKDEVADLDQRIGDLQARRTVLVAESDDLVSQRPNSHRNSHVGVVKAYLKSQRKVRQVKRAAK